MREFPCQQLNRDVWSNEAVRNIIKEHFVLWQVRRVCHFVFSETYFRGEGSSWSEAGGCQEVNFNLFLKPLIYQTVLFGSLLLAMILISRKISIEHCVICKTLFPSWIEADDDDDVDVVDNDDDEDDVDGNVDDDMMMMMTMLMLMLLTMMMMMTTMMMMMMMMMMMAMLMMRMMMLI